MYNSSILQILFVSEYSLQGNDRIRFFAEQSMLQIGKGSGCLSITLARLYPQWKIHACDISAAALRVARNNVSLHRCRARLRFHRGDLFDGHFLANETFEVIISNPPYISDEERPQCDRSIFYEPSIALFVRPPLKYYAELIRRARQGWLKTGGHLIFECSLKTITSIYRKFVWTRMDFRVSFRHENFRV